jgi:glucose/arabinose dehydrogenase
MKEGRIASERRFLRGELGRIRDVRVDSNNLVYFVTDGLAGEVYRLEPVVEQAHQEERRRR